MYPRDPNSRLQLCHSTDILSNPSVRSHLRRSEDYGVAASGLALSEGNEASLFECIPVNSRVWALQFIGSWKMHSRRSNRRHVFRLSVRTYTLHSRCNQEHILPEAARPLTSGFWLESIVCPQTRRIQEALLVSITAAQEARSGY